MTALAGGFTPPGFDGGVADPGLAGGFTPVKEVEILYQATVNSGAWCQPASSAPKSATTNMHCNASETQPLRAITLQQLKQENCKPSLGKGC